MALPRPCSGTRLYSPETTVHRTAPARKSAGFAGVGGQQSDRTRVPLDCGDQMLSLRKRVSPITSGLLKKQRGLRGLEGDIAVAALAGDIVEHPVGENPIALWRVSRHQRQAGAVLVLVRSPGFRVPGPRAALADLAGSWPRLLAVSDVSALRPAFKSPDKRELSSLFLYAAVAIPVFYLPALFYGPHTNFAVIDNWRF